MLFPPLHSLNGSPEGVVVDNYANRGCILGNIGVPPFFAISSFNFAAVTRSHLVASELKKAPALGTVQQLHRLFLRVLPTILREKREQKAGHGDPEIDNAHGSHYALLNHAE